MNFSFFRFTFIPFFFLAFLVSCSTFGGSSGNAKKGKIASEAKSGGNEGSKKYQNFLLVGAQGYAGKGAIFKCSLDGENCTEFLGGNSKFKAPEDRKQKAVKIFPGDRFGASIFVSKDKIFIGAIGRDNKKANDAGSISSANYKDDVGTIFQCDLDGSNCIELVGGHIGFPTTQNSINLLSGDYLGSSIYAIKDKILIGAMGRDSNSDDEVGTVFQCGLDGTNCFEFMGGKSKSNEINKSLEKFDAFGASIFASNSNLFVSAKNKNGGNGRVFKCNLTGEKCSMLEIKNLRLSTNDAFGSSLAGNANHIFVGAIGRNGFPPTNPALYDIGSVFKCNIDGSNCSEFVGGEIKASDEELALSLKDYLGSSLAVSGNYLFIGATGRKNDSNIRTGAVFRCDLDAKNCKEIVGGQNNDSFDSDDVSLVDGDLVGSSLAIVTLPDEED